MIAGVILAGGQSSRYGEPKMFVTYKEQPLYMQSVQALNVAVSLCIIATNAVLRPQFQINDVDFLLEEQPHQGPLVALQQVMQHYSHVDWFFVLASDMPLINEQFVKTLLDAIDPVVDVIMPTQNEQIQPLAALYHRRILPIIDEAIHAKKRSMKAILHKANVRYITFDETQNYFININRQQDWPKELKDD